MTTQLVMHGDERLTRELDEGVRDLADMRETHRAAGQIVESEAMRRVPRVSGRLARSHAVEAAPGFVNITADTPYAGVIHWGWPGHNIEPSYWLTQALDKSQPKIEAVYLAEADRVLSECAGKATP